MGSPTPPALDRLVLATLFFALAAHACFALTPDDENVWGLRRLRTEVIEGLRDGDLEEYGPWTLRYTGPHERGTVVWVTMQPDEAFETKRIDRDEFQVRVKNKRRLLTKITGDLRPIGVKVLKTLEEPGEGRVYVAFPNKEGEDLPLTRLKKMGMIVRLDWTSKEAVEFLGYSKKDEASFRRKPGHENTSVEVLLTVREEGHNYVYSSWLPRLGDTMAVAPRRCREERMFQGKRVVTLRTPWVKSTDQRALPLARRAAQDRVWQEMRSHCEGTLGGELVLDTVRFDYDIPLQEFCGATLTCKAAVAATYQCKIRQYETVEICN
jgi:hypothetical protein